MRRNIDIEAKLRAAIEVKVAEVESLTAKNRQLEELVAYHKKNEANAFAETLARREAQAALHVKACEVIARFKRELHELSIAVEALK